MCGAQEEGPQGMKYIKNAQQIRRAQAYIAQNHTRNIAINDLADLARMSRFHFARVFRAATGITPMQAVVRARVECVKLKLITGRDSIAAIAHTCGFASQSHMGRVFRQATGETPAGYRARVFTRPE